MTAGGCSADNNLQMIYFLICSVARLKKKKKLALLPAWWCVRRPTSGCVYGLSSELGPTQEQQTHSGPCLLVYWFLNDRNFDLVLSDLCFILILNLLSWHALMFGTHQLLNSFMLFIIFFLMCHWFCTGDFASNIYLRRLNYWCYF